MSGYITLTLDDEEFVYCPRCGKGVINVQNRVMNGEDYETVVCSVCAVAWPIEGGED